MRTSFADSITSPLVRTRKTSRRFSRPYVNIQDTETLLNALMLLSTFLLAFSAGTLIEYSYDDFLGIDTRSISSVVERLRRNPLASTDVNLTSSVVLRGFLLATTLLMISLSIGVGCYLSLSISYCRENPALFYRWAIIHQWFILMGYICFLCGAVTYVVAIRVLLEAVFPAWCVSDGAAHTNHDTLYTFFSPLKYVYNSSSEEPLLLDGSEEEVSSSGNGEFSKYKYEFDNVECYAVNKNIASFYKRQMVGWMIGVMLSTLCFAIFVQFWPSFHLWLVNVTRGEQAETQVQRKNRRTTKLLLDSFDGTPSRDSLPYFGSEVDIDQLSEKEQKALRHEHLLRVNDEDLIFELAELNVEELIECIDNIQYVDQILKDAGIRPVGRRVKLVNCMRRIARHNQDNQATLRRATNRPSLDSKSSSMKEEGIEMTESDLERKGLQGSVRRGGLEVSEPPGLR